MLQRALLDQSGSTTSLRRLRLSFVNAVLREYPVESPIPVAAYALVMPGQDPVVRLSEAHRAAQRQHFHVVESAADTTGPCDPAIRPQLARFYGAVTSGEIRGIVASSSTDLSDIRRDYQKVLVALNARRGFLALARIEGSL